MVHDSPQIQRPRWTPDIFNRNPPFGSGASPCWHMIFKTSGSQAQRRALFRAAEGLLLWCIKKDVSDIQLDYTLALTDGASVHAFLTHRLVGLAIFRDAFVKSSWVIAGSARIREEKRAGLWIATSDLDTHESVNVWQPRDGEFYTVHPPSEWPTAVRSVFVSTDFATLGFILDNRGKWTGRTDV